MKILSYIRSHKLVSILVVSAIVLVAASSIAYAAINNTQKEEAVSNSTPVATQDKPSVPEPAIEEEVSVVTDTPEPVVQVQEPAQTTTPEPVEAPAPTRTLEDVTLQEILDKTFTKECTDKAMRSWMVDTTRFEWSVKEAIRGGNDAFPHQIYIGTNGERACVYYGTKADLGL